MKNTWDSLSAEHYVEYCRHHDTYQTTSAHLVASGARFLDHPQRIVDLACGTGVTANIIRQHFGSSPSLTCIDQSAEMLAVAQSLPQLSGAVFVHGAAEMLDQTILPGVDIILCNSAFWLMNMPLVLRAAAAVLRPAGLFAFSMPGYLLRDACDARPIGRCPILMEAFQAAAGGNATPSSLHPTVSEYALSETAITRMAARAGLNLLDRQFFTTEEALDTTYDALCIPALLQPYSPTLAEHERLPLLQTVMQSLAGSQATSVRWYSYILKKQQ